MSVPKAPPGHFTLLYFAAATSFTRKQHDFFAAPLPLAQLYDDLDKHYAGIKEKVLESSALTVNLDYVEVEEETAKGDKGLVIQAGDEVAIIPPQSNSERRRDRDVKPRIRDRPTHTLTSSAGITSAAFVMELHIDRSSRQTTYTSTLRSHELNTAAMSSSKPQTFIYKTAGKVEIPFDLYLPENAKNVPVLLWFHGGGLLQGKRTSVTPHMLRAVSEYNIALISADYRLAPQVGVADIFEDVKDCVAFIRTELTGHVGDGVLDTSRLAVSGSSAGGYLAFLAGLYVEPKPKVILPIYPITDPLGTFFTNPQPHPFGGGRTDPEPLASFLDPNGEVVAYNEEDSKRNQLYFVMMQEANLASLLKVKPGDDTFRIARKIYEQKLPPTYVVHGDADSAVGVEQADEVVGVMVGLGMEVEYERMHGINHLFDRDEEYKLEKMYEFMLKHL